MEEKVFKIEEDPNPPHLQEVKVEEPAKAQKPTEEHPEGVTQPGAHPDSV